MRIRKNAKLSSLQLLSGGSSSHVSGVDGQLLLQPHVCQLNQSPWDAPEDSFLALPLLQYQWEDSFTGTVNSLNDSAPTQDSFPFGFGFGLEPKEKLIVKGRKVIGAGTTRKKKARKEGSLGNYDTVVAGGGEAAGNHRRKKKDATLNPYEFYYYTGFGPCWRRRGGNGENGQNSNFNVTGNSSYTTPCIAVNGDNGMDMMMMEEEDEDEDGESNGDGGKKRQWKRVKARSLKSLM